MPIDGKFDVNDKRAAITAFQRIGGNLIANGIYFGELHGIFDENTKNTVLHFQKVWNLNQHGIAGTHVWRKLLG